MNLDTESVLVLGTRGSALALRQTELMAERLRSVHRHIQLRVETISTRGDRIQGRPISALGDKGVFVRPLQEALLTGQVDIAVHSLKDVPADVDVPGLVLRAFPDRADPRDALVSNRYESLDELPPGARVGTGSLRRHVLLRVSSPALEVVPVRGNVDTRLRKLDSGEVDALILAAAGLDRLGLSARIRERLAPDRFVPDAGQGIIAVETRDSGPAFEAVAAIDRAEVRQVATIEREVIRTMQAGCHSPVGVYARLRGNAVELTAMAAGARGSEPTRIRETVPLERAVDMARSVGERLRSTMLGYD